ncbi:hypothetical protein EJB05_23058 [Eragrostis curvula]|uniref:Uncharacterized protein n=1 Tax=Eragrostis curvula TaxID=38414 RepID=A0A5J9V602_9POAL|nr:hypothetical protein EJB05_23058 [Eragrostis curvula]
MREVELVAAAAAYAEVTLRVIGRLRPLFLAPTRCGVVDPLFPGSDAMQSGSVSGGGQGIVLCGCAAARSRKSEAALCLRVLGRVLLCAAAGHTARGRGCAAQREVAGMAVAAEGNTRGPDNLATQASSSSFGHSPSMKLFKIHVLLASARAIYSSDCMSCVVQGTELTRLLTLLGTRVGEWDLGSSKH